MNRKVFILIVLTAQLALANQCQKSSNERPPTGNPPVTTLRNPIITGADPWVYQAGTVYYYMHTLGDRVAIWKTDSMPAVANAQRTTIFTPTPGEANSRNVWAPEIHKVDGKWYTYFTAGSGPDSTQRLWVIENPNEDPTTGTWTSKGRIFSPAADFWAIDGTVLEHDGIKYFLWSGRPDHTKQDQNIYISRMENAWTLTGPVTMLTAPQLPWERVGGPVNEGPQILKNPEGDVFVIYSASGCWTDDYALGMLRLKDGGDPMQLDDWIKSQQPVFTKHEENNAFGPGHNSFFKSPDQKQDWIIYHANLRSGDGCSNKRNVRIQPFTWNADGTPNFGRPVKAS